MYKILPIGGKDYKLEYTVEASLYGDCTEALIDFFGKAFGTSNAEELTEGMSEEQKIAVRQALLKNSISGISNLPQTALTVFYAGLLEHHGPEGDGKVTTKAEAKELVRQYFEDHKDDGTGNFFDLMFICVEQMGEDVFFDKTGLSKVLGAGQTAQKSLKRPQDHKKPSGK